MRIIPFLFLFTILTSWGFKAHRNINELAVFMIPNDTLYSFYFENIAYVTEHAVDADKRKFTNHKEVPSHFIDLDKYPSTDTFDLKQCSFNEIQYEFEELFLQEHGTLPWTITRTYWNLVESFKNGNVNNIKRYSSDLGHYIADAHVPLHTVSNYDGQHTHQHGIHSLWETQVPELFMDTIIVDRYKVKYIGDVNNYIWSIIDSSHFQAKEVLKVDKDLRDSLNYDVFSVNNEYGQVRFSQMYCEHYLEKLSLKVNEKFISASACIASFWLSAWIDAGQPNLNHE